MSNPQRFDTSAAYPDAIAECNRLRTVNAELLAALLNTELALTYANGKLNNPTINGHKEVARILHETRATIAKATQS